ncbi:hypothetical protein E0485_16595 [Paenibacillus albiflavus]|uniref:Spore coat protein n=1 Tax=Paenibacillus albiflavus TaxID=2545760 RepID=A0A4R4ECM9_9BACL|nr:hypothetical protein [Paenibacillus albiflavus]TCZ75715.1 hypothetical protein E0485_16595 [Paenibacillus albiflavus]
MSWIKWLVRVASGAIVVSLITLIMTWYVVSLVVTNICEQLKLPADMIPQVQLSDVLTGMFHKPEPGKSKANNLEPKESTQPLEQSNVPKDSTEVKGSPAPESDGAIGVWKQNNQIVMDRDAIIKLKDEISTEDKMKIFNIISAKVPENDIQTISKLLENGLTNEGLEQMQEILWNRLDSQEYQELMGILDLNNR